MIHYPSTPIHTGDLPYPSNNDVQIFIGPTSGSTTHWQTWNKPKGSTMMHIVALSGGAGGGGGGQAAAGTNKGGGGGGGSSGIATLTIPSLFMPDILYVLPGNGGRGSPPSTAGAVAGNPGGISYISYSQNTAAPNVLLQSNAVAPVAGTTGGSGATGAGGAGGTIATISVGALIGLTSFIAGQAGSAGGNTTTNGADLTIWSSIFLSGGTGAGGAVTANPTKSGGNLAANTATNTQFVNWPTGVGGVLAGGTSTAQRGNSGVMLWKPFITSGGTGSGTDNTTAGDGGSGGIGSGGGGAGAAVTAGNGGNGGPGMIMIISW